MFGQTEFELEWRFIIYQQDFRCRGELAATLGNQTVILDKSLPGLWGKFLHWTFANLVLCW